MLAGVLSTAVSGWAHFYSDSTVTQDTVTFVHIGGLVVSGGLALASDRSILRASREAPAVRALRLADLDRAHRQVVVGLGFVFATGVLLLLSDLDTFLGSWIFWVKMGLIALLLTNGALLLRAERRVGMDPEADGGWRSLRRGALLSITLWMTITAAGAALVNAA
jgi:hypothetical protein